MGTAVSAEGLGQNGAERKDDVGKEHVRGEDKRNRARSRTADAHVKEELIAQIASE